jgi:hypothetical protein
MRNIKTHIGLGLTSAVLASTASAGMTGNAYEVGRAWSGEDFGGTAVSGYVVDVYLEFNSESDILLNVYNFNDVNMGTTYFQGLTAAGWAPNEQGSIFTTGVSQMFDSFIAIGGVTNEGMDGNPYQMAGNGVAVDPNFDNNNAAGPMENAGWFNGNPNNPIGSAANEGLVLIGRFSIAGSDGFSMQGGTGFATFNEGIGTPGQQDSFTIVPAPGALALLGLAGLAGRRRRK